MELTTKPEAASKNTDSVTFAFCGSGVFIYRLRAFRFLVDTHAAFQNVFSLPTARNYSNLAQAAFLEELCTHAATNLTPLSPS